MRHLLLLPTLCFWYSCHTPASEPSSAAKILQPTEGEDFRRISIGDNFKMVWEKEKDHIVYSMPDELTCRIPLNDKDSTYYDITYNFTEEGLYDISLEIFSAAGHDLDKLASEFLLYYTERYGPSQRNAGVAEWRVVTANGHMVKITLNDSLVKNGDRGIRVNFNEYNR